MKYIKMIIIALVEVLVDLYTNSKNSGDSS